MIYDSKPRTSFFAHERMYASLLENQWNGDLNVLLVKLKIFQKVAWIRSHHLHLQWKFKLCAGKFPWDVKAKHCWALSTNFSKQKVCWHHPAKFCLITSSNFPATKWNFHWRWRWWDRIKAIFLDIFYFQFFPLLKLQWFCSVC